MIEQDSNNQGHRNTASLTSQEYAEIYQGGLETLRSTSNYQVNQDEITEKSISGKNDNGNSVSSNQTPSSATVSKTKEVSSKRMKRKSFANAGQFFRQMGRQIPWIKDRIAPEVIIDTSTIERRIYVNQFLPDFELNEQRLPSAQYCRNKIRTTKYTPLTFIPLNLFYQFHNIANIYFLFIAVLSQFRIFGVGSPGLAAVPIIVIVLITAIKDAIEDFRRAALDSELNNTVTHILTNFDNHNVIADNISLWRKFKKLNTRGVQKTGRALYILYRKMRRKPIPKRLTETKTALDLHPVISNQTGNRPSTTIERINTRPSMSESIYEDVDSGDTVLDKTRAVPGKARFTRKYWKSVTCGDIVKVYNNEEFPADLVILSTSDDDGACFIETRNLDGETNLKSRQSLKATSDIKRAKDLERSQFRIHSEGPHAGLYSYSGVLKWDQITEDGPEERSEPISINNLLLRGCTLRNTKWIIGVCVYTGDDTKVMLNAGVTPAKRSRITRELNFNVICNFVFLFILALVAGILEGIYWRRTDTSAFFFEFGSTGGSAPIDGLITFWAAVILLQNLIPISLYITIEIIKSFQAFFIWSDLYMYYEPLDYPCTPKSWSISDDLGQVEYIFSDKTGTLTQNVMEFRKCTVNGKSYGKAFTEAMLGMLKRTHDNQESEEIDNKVRMEIIEDKKLMIEKLNSIYDNPELINEDKLQFISSEIVDDMLGKSDKTQKDAVAHFLLCLALCHSVLPERVDGMLSFKAQSPDEEALVATACHLGYVVTNRNRSSLELNVQGLTCNVDVLKIIEFTSARKRMSVIVRLPNTGKILLISKGADSMIYSRLSQAVDQESIKEKTAKDLENFASEGLRTLCIAEREIPEDVYQEWAARHDEASQAIYNREEEMESLADEIERELVLLGGTAIEDRLQDGVPSSIALLGQAGIKIWVLTGDKVETAINIGYSCNLLENDMTLLVVQLENFNREEADMLLSEHLGKNFGLKGTQEEIDEAKLHHEPTTSRFALVIDGEALGIVLDEQNENLRSKFVLLGKQCKSVLCCRVSPSQKAAVVELVKEKLDVMTLSIGDGANDVAMIQEADVGVGIAGLEGRQAVMSSDYGIGQFRFLTRLMLVHGRYAYRRLCEMAANLFYKNVVFTLTLFWYDVNNSFDGSYLFDYTYITLFNLAFTSLPVIFMGFLDKDVSEKVSLAVPQLYQRGILRKEWTQTKFWIYMTDGVYQSAVCYFLAFSLFFNGGFVTENGLQINSREFYGVFVATPAIAICNLYVMMNEYQWDWLFLLIVGISIGLVFFWTGVYTAFTSSTIFYKAAPEIYSSLPFWANTLLVLIACLLPRFAAKSYQKLFRPMDVDIIREQVRQKKFDYLSNEDVDFGRKDVVQQELEQQQLEEIHTALSHTTSMATSRYDEPIPLSVDTGRRKRKVEA